MKNKLKAFTLAETLVTLAIIGVIFTLTIPSLNTSMRKRENLLALQKAHTTISSATEILIREYGPIRFWRFSEAGFIMDKMFIPRMNVMRNCKNAGGCFEQGYTTKSLSGTANNAFQTDGSWYTFVTADGLYWAASAPVAACTNSEGNYIANGCMYFEVDVNGPKKPNTVGIDIFGFVLTRQGMYPYGSCPGCSTSQCIAKTGTGWGCTGKLLHDKKYSW